MQVIHLAPSLRNHLSKEQAAIQTQPEKEHKCSSCFISIQGLHVIHMDSMSLCLSLLSPASKSVFIQPVCI